MTITLILGNQIVKYLADKAEVLGVVRLPDNTFKVLVPQLLRMSSYYVNTGTKQTVLQLMAMSTYTTNGGLSFHLVIC